MAETVRELGVKENTLYNWVYQHSHPTKPDKGLLWHTDRDSQYASDSHRKLLKQHGIQQSMSRQANCWDNAVSESFFHTLKTECVNATREAAKKSIFDYIEVFYNRQRLHSSNG